MVIVNDKRLNRLARKLAMRANCQRRLARAEARLDSYYVGVWTRNLNDTNAAIYQLAGKV